ncbi:MAG TPA: aminoacyl-tRNA hydrolase [Alphaproteobacteria bacterium]|nr:aminoacyl-tRNA hydrolase [Alphaproteobacteria bacterium]
MPNPSHLIVGLGNPGEEYAGTRHNIGFMTVDVIARENGAMPWKSKFKGQLSSGKIGAHDVLYLKPETYMNLSGESVGEAMRFYKLTPAQVVVFHDEIDLPIGELRTKKGGGAAGHNGLKSIDQHIGQDYWRVRIGVGHPGDREMVSGHVLGKFSKNDLEAVAPPVEKFISGLAEFLGGLK